MVTTRTVHQQFDARWQYLPHMAETTAFARTHPWRDINRRSSDVAIKKLDDVSFFSGVDSLSYTYESCMRTSFFQIGLLTYHISSHDRWYRVTNVPQLNLQGKIHTYALSTMLTGEVLRNFNKAERPPQELKLEISHIYGYLGDHDRASGLTNNNRLQVCSLFQHM